MKKAWLIAAGLVLGTPLANPALAAEKVTLQLKWVTQAQFAGYYVAAAKGYYKDAGLDVDHQSRRTRHRTGAGDRRRRRRRHHRLDAVRPGLA